MPAWMVLGRSPLNLRKVQPTCSSIVRTKRGEHVVATVVSPLEHAVVLNLYEAWDTSSVGDVAATVAAFGQQPWVHGT